MFFLFRVLTLLNGQLEHVPSSRADVFGTKHVSVVEKRILMKAGCEFYKLEVSLQSVKSCIKIGPINKIHLFGSVLDLLSSL